MLRTKLSAGLLFLCATALLSSCGHTQVPNATACTAAGSLSSGAICAETNTGKTSELTLTEFIEFLEPQSDRAGAICMSTKDWTAMKIALEQACRAMGARCSYEMKALIQSMPLVN